MKKIISSIALLFICSLSANAQDNKKAGSSDAISSSKPEANKQDLSKSPKYLAYELGKFLKLDETLVVNFISLLQMKEEIMFGKGNSLERKTIFMESFVEKLRASLDEKRYEMLLSNKALYTSLTEIPEEAKK